LPINEPGFVGEMSTLQPCFMWDVDI